ncbi:hypothetical protein AKI39_16355 [Bordetella sp. H567]|uniref:transporter substrate-binding domain-containing protein n=1 Tax=Bordetella sp. H567 TaxID=1697043 RepID=UPI00081C88B9|nr:transporter substrate-binding domain-containing protein [Bordetella sp. H567]AOB31941.1 hypothetical protein AKI39_16355 [Bordetella sp. H567]
MKTPFKFEGTDETRQRIAPGGSLRMGLYQGSPSSYVRDPASGQASGVGYLLGECFARSLGVAFSPCLFQSNQEVLAAVKSATVDLVFTNATRERAQYIAFASVLLTVGKTVLVTPQSPVQDMQSLGAARFKIGYSQGSTTGTEFSSIFPKAELVPMENLDRAAAALRAGEVDGFATNMAILSKVAAAVPGARILPGSWGLEQYALGMPQGRQDALQALSSFSAWAARSGALAAFIGQSGFAGAEPVKAPASAD